jgi:hypothetical protein
VETEAGQTFLTDVEICAANEDDSEVVAAIQRRLLRQGMSPAEQIVDAGYVSGGTLAASQGQGIALVGPAPPDNSGKPAGYRQQDFVIDETRQIATCPEGATSVGWFPRRGKKEGIYIRFGTQCHQCPARAVCAPGKHGRTLFLNAHVALLMARRVEQQSSLFWERMKQRAAIEGTISALVRKHGARRARYRGRGKVRFQYLATGAAVNLKHLARALHQQRQEADRNRAMA